MKRLAFALGFAGIAAVTFVFWTPLTRTLAEMLIEDEPDMPALLRERRNSAIDPGIAKEEYLENRAKAAALRRGIEDGKPVDPRLRQDAVEKIEKQEESLRSRPESPDKLSLTAAWTAIGPAPIVSGSARYSGRTIAIAVHPTNENIVYVGTAQGGLYRSTDGGTNWTPLMDGAQSLAIGAVAISPSNPEVVYVGTGEPNFSTDSFFGVGIYRIDNASTTANLTGPLNKDAGNADVFTGRAISEIVVHPTDPATIFVSTTSGLGGIGGAANPVLPSRGVYRSTNATSGVPTFTKLTGLAANTNSSVRDIAIDPSNPNILVAGLVASGPTGGIYRSTDALAATPTFNQTFSYSGTSTSELNTELTSIHPVGDANATFYAASGNLGGRVLISTDGGASWTERIDNNFCTPQCFYDIAIAVDPTNVNKLYLGGSPAVVAAFSTTGGTAFTEGGAGVHVDTHALTVAPSNPNVVYLGTDGGIYKSTNGGAGYTHLNSSQFFATQFMSIAVHPTSSNFTIGGTQDNGTLYLDPPASGWNRVDGGDGGYTVIDQNAADTTNVRMYHTYFSQLNNVVGYATRATTSAGWSFRGCNGTTPANGINCADTAVLFYAPLESGPGNPNTVYYGTDRLYRSADNGTSHTVVSQAPISSGIAVSAIGISAQNDNIRIVGLRDGGLWGVRDGSTTLTDLDPTNQVTNGFIARAVIDPNNSSTAYVTVANFGVANVFKTTNWTAGAPTWTNISGTIPAVPVSAFVVDPLNSNILYAGTDIGVYASTDGGSTWSPFGTGLPRAAVFDMAISAAPRKLRIATHGKGMFEIPVIEPTVRRHLDFDGDARTDISIFRPSSGQWWLNRSTAGLIVHTFGNSADNLAPADFTGDGKTDVAIFRPSDGSWYVLRSEDSTFYSFPFGTSGDIPVPADYDGDAKADAAVFRPSSATWFIQRSSGGTTIAGFGSSTDFPVPADYDGDGKADIAIYRPSLGQWWLNRSTAGLIVHTFGTSTDKNVQGDYTGDGKADVAIWRPSTGEWFILRSEDSSFFSFPFGASGDLPSPGDYDGDGKFDAAVFRPSGATWYVQRSTAGLLIQGFGAATDLPVPNYGVRP